MPMINNLVKMTNEIKATSQWPPMDWSSVPDAFICPKCKVIIKNAHQAHDCGCQYCLECLDQLTSKGNDQADCLKCGLKLESDAKFPDRNLQNKIKKFLNSTKTKCTICFIEVSLEEYQNHYSQEHVPQTTICKFCSKKFSNKNELDQHNDIDNGNCPDQPLDCPFKSIGCLGQNDNSSLMDIEMHSNNFTRKTLEEHMNLRYSYHLMLVNYSLGKRIEVLELFNPNESNKHALLIPPFGYEKTETSKTSNADSGYDSRYPEAAHSSSNSLTENKFSGASFGTSLSSVSSLSFSSTNTKILETRLNDMNMKLEALENNQKNLMSDLFRLQKSNDNFKQENLKYKENNKEYKTICQDLHRTLALTQVSLLTLEERLINQEKLSYNGTLLWKITNVQERIQEAKSGRQTSFYSPPFYTERNGFKMCARIYLNGDGNGRNTHLSLFFVILRGEYDALLKWPFRQKVTFILIDQSSSESKENVYDAFRPDPNSSSFRRPVSEMNIASGLPVFCPLGKLLSDDHEYIKDNTMFIKIIVDTKDLSEI